MPYTRAATPFSVCADDYAPPGAKSKWLAAFYLCIPVGYALVSIFLQKFGSPSAMPLSMTSDRLLASGMESPAFFLHPCWCW